MPNYDKHHLCNLYNNPDPEMSLLEAIRTRRTVRSYQNKIIPHETIEEILRESTHAPSACNRRGWRFILIEDKQKLEWLYKKGAAAFVKNVNQAILACYYNNTDNFEWNDVDQSAAAAIAYFQALAHTRGIGSCWICHLPPKREIKKYFELPKQYDPIALISIGYYKENLKIRSRDVTKEEILSINKWGFSEIEEKEVAGLKMILRRFARKMYYILPKREILRNMTKRFEKKFDDDEK